MPIKVTKLLIFYSIYSWFHITFKLNLTIIQYNKSHRINQVHNIKYMKQLHTNFAQSNVLPSAPS